MYNLKRHIREIHTASHDVATTRGWITSSTLPPYSGVAPPPLSHGGVTPTPSQHDGVTYDHKGVTPPPPPLHVGVTPPPPPHDGVNYSMYEVSV